MQWVKWPGVPVPQEGLVEMAKARTRLTEGASQCSGRCQEGPPRRTGLGQAGDKCAEAAPTSQTSYQPPASASAFGW